MRTLIIMTSLITLLPLSLAQTHAEFTPKPQKTAAAKYLGLDMVEIVGGTGEETDHGRIALHWDLKTFRLFGKRFETSVAGSYAVYDLAERNSSGTTQLRDLGLTPNLLYRFGKSSWGIRPFVEGGIGFHYLTEKDIAKKDFSTHFQFGDHFSVGLEFGKRLSYRINYQFQHLSNGGIDSPNPGINFHLLSFGAQFR